MIRIILALVILSGFAQAAPKLPPKERFHLFLLVGQSNMAGRGKVTEQDRKPHPGVLTLTKDLKWRPATDPLHFDKPKIVGVGLGKSFGIEVAKTDPNITVGLIPCAVGGSPIDSWTEGAFYKPTKSHPWDDAMKRAKHALKNGELKGILWHQGESDSKEKLSETYEKKLHALIERFRTELGAQNAPFIAGQMGQFPEKRPWNEHKKRVDRVHRELGAKVFRSAFVNSDGLKDKDGVHFNAAGFREMGRRYAKAYFDLTPAQGAVIDNPKLPFTIERTVASIGFDKTFCWVHARAGAIPAKVIGAENPLVVMTMQKLKLSGSDVFYALNNMHTSDLGKTWSGVDRQDVFARQKVSDRVEMTVCDFWPRWHEKTGKLLGTGHTVVYQDNKVKHVRPRATPYSIYDPKEHQWSAWKTLEIPDRPEFKNAGAGCVQRFDLPNGDILLPFYFKEPSQKQYNVTVALCRFDGETLSYVKHGNEMTISVQRGFVEPSVTGFGGRFYLTLRNDVQGHVCVSDDGLNYSKPKKWTFDDGAEIGNYNTQQHWVVHEKGLFLCYNRKGAGNDHVFRHRAPLFIAQVDPEKLRIIRSTEQILVPEFGARLGNFGVTDVSSDETWVTVTEWMQTKAPHWNDSSIPMSYGSNNRVWVAKLKWR
ncbi:MAG: sialate O-acetylesterase [Limisphaerales bacterium]